MMKTVCRSLLATALLMSVCLSVPAALAQNFSEVKPAPQQTEWQDLEFGVILHFSTNTFLDREWGEGKASPSVFNPTDFNPDQWMQAIKASGAKYVVLVAKHHDGFCLWPTAQTDYSIKSSPWKDGKGDVVGDVARSARKYGLKFGVYLSPWDRHEPKYSDPVAYDKYYLSELEELASNYGDLVEFWLDGAGSGGHVYNFSKIIETLRTYQPNSIVFADTGLFEYGDARWVGTESGTVAYENWNVIDRHGYLRWRPIEADTPLRKEHWFWHPNDEQSLKSAKELMTTYEQTVGRGAQLMLGVAPDKRGLLPDSDAARLKEFGEAIQSRYGRNLVLDRAKAGDRGEAAVHKSPLESDPALALDGDPDTFWSAPIGSHHADLEIDLAKPVRFNRVLTMEWLNDGQHVQKYSIDAWVGGKWTTVAAGEAIGHKKIDSFQSITASRIRLRILSSTSEAHIRELQLYEVD